MEEFVYYNALFDIYSELLTEKERETFKDYYQEDLSLSEIASEKNVSRSAVFKTLNTVLEKLKYYEEKLHIYDTNILLLDAMQKDDIAEIKEIIGKVLND